ncbi:MAG: hypothetical protein Q8K61_10910 [Gallionella sp.]|nr:hypothetical protein [Gallionella sp.]
MSLRRAFFVVASNHFAASRTQKSLANGFGSLARAGGRGRGADAARRVSVQPVIARKPDFLVWWSALMLRRCGSAHAIAKQFDVTDQTGQNWINADACPSGWVVYQAQRFWPEEFELDGGRDA